MGKAIHDWDMILDNDRILVGVSGGKDSMVLLDRLFYLKERAPVHFDIFPVHIDAGFKNSPAEKIKDFVDHRYCLLEVEYTDHGIQAHSEKNRENPCFLCSRLRRKRLFEMAQERSCKKVALGHNKDDIIETLFINIFYAGRIGTLKPRQSFFNHTLDIIRPLSYVEKTDISAFKGQSDLPGFANNCPSAGQTKRSEVREMLEGLYRKNGHIKGNIFRAMSNVATDYLLN